MSKFDRENYYSQSEVIKKFKITPEKYQQLTKDLPQINRVVEIKTGTYKPFKVRTIYIRKDVVDKLDLELR